MIVLFTDFGVAGPYIGEMQAVLYSGAPGIPVVNLFADAPAFDPLAAAHLLAAYVPRFAPDSVFLAVVDPGVGGERAPVLARADGRWLVGPGNGLFGVVLARARDARLWRLSDLPEHAADTFHGRDIFAPAAATLARGGRVSGESLPLPDNNAGDDLPRVIYIDGFGNAMTGLRADALAESDGLTANGYRFIRARTFGDVREGKPLCYRNSVGLMELAANRASAAREFGLKVGDVVQLISGQ